MSTILNFLWFLIMWWWQWLIYMFLAFIFSLTVIFLPLAKSLRQIAKLIIMPFWKEIIRDKEQWTYDKSFWLVFNIVWFPIWLILSIFYFIVWILSFLTIIWIPSWIVMVKLAKIIIMPIWVKVVTKKEYIQWLVKEELKNHNLNNQKNELTIEEKAKMYDEVSSKNKYKTDEEKLKENVEIFNNAMTPYSKYLKRPLFILVNILFILNSLASVFMYWSIVYWILFIILFVLFIFQTYLYISKKKNIKRKYNYEMLFFINTLLLIIIFNISYLIISIWSEWSWFFIANQIFLIYQYVSIYKSFNNLWWIDWIIKELENFKNIKLFENIIPTIQTKLETLNK